MPPAAISALLISQASHPYTMPTSTLPTVNGVFVHPTADVDATAAIGEGTSVWHQAQVMPGVTVGRWCTIAKGAFVGSGSTLGDQVKVGNYTNVFGARVADEAFLGPMVCLLEDPWPRSTMPDGRRRGQQDFVRRPVVVERGASLGAGSIVLPGVRVGAWGMAGAGSVVHRDVPPHGLVAGSPARHLGYVCRCGERLDDALRCTCGFGYALDEDGLLVLGPPAPETA